MPTSTDSSAKDNSKEYEWGPVEQLRIAFGNPLSMLLGGVFGGAVPIASYFVAHQERGEMPTLQWIGQWVLVAGALVFSSKTVVQWGLQVWGDWWKAVGFVVLAEGVMVAVPIEWLSQTMLVGLTVINTLANGSSLALRDVKDKLRKAELKRLKQAAELERTAPEPLLDVRPHPLAPDSEIEQSNPSHRPSRKLPTSSQPDCPTVHDDEYDRARELVLSGKCDSISALQRTLRVGYLKASRFFDRMRSEGLLEQLALPDARKAQPPALPNTVTVTQPTC